MYLENNKWLHKWQLKYIFTWVKLLHSLKTLTVSNFMLFGSHNFRIKSIQFWLHVLKYRYIQSSQCWTYGLLYIKYYVLCPRYVISMTRVNRRVNKGGVSREGGTVAGQRGRRCPSQHCPWDTATAVTTTFHASLIDLPLFIRYLNPR